MSSIKHEGLLDEKKIWHIYSKSRSIPSSKFNFWTTLAFSFFLSLDLVIGSLSNRDVYQKIDEFVQNGLVVSLSTLAVLVAGYTIFATLTQPSLSIAMNRQVNSVSGLTYLKHNHFVFVRVFVYYLVYSVFCLFIMLFAHDKGSIYLIVNSFPDSDIIAGLLVKSTYLALYVGLYFLIMQLKSFIFNLYHSVMTSLMWELVQESEVD